MNKDQTVSGKTNSQAMYCPNKSWAGCVKTRQEIANRFPLIAQSADNGIRIDSEEAMAEPVHGDVQLKNWNLSLVLKCLWVRCAALERGTNNDFRNGPSTRS